MHYEQVGIPETRKEANMTTILLHGAAAVEQNENDTVKMATLITIPAEAGSPIVVVVLIVFL